MSPREEHLAALLAEANRRIEELEAENRGLILDAGAGMDTPEPTLRVIKGGMPQ